MSGFSQLYILTPRFVFCVCLSIILRINWRWGKSCPVCKLEGVWGRGGKSTVLNLGCRWSLAVSYSPRLIYPGGSPLYAWKGGGALSGSRSLCGHLEENAHTSPALSGNSSFVQPINSQTFVKFRRVLCCWDLCPEFNIHHYLIGKASVIFIFIPNSH